MTQPSQRGRALSWKPLTSTSSTRAPNGTLVLIIRTFTTRCATTHMFVWLFTMMSYYILNERKKLKERNDKFKYYTGRYTSSEWMNRDLGSSEDLLQFRKLSTTVCPSGPIRMHRRWSINTAKDVSAIGLRIHYSSLVISNHFAVQSRQYGF